MSGLDSLGSAYQDDDFEDEQDEAAIHRAQVVNADAEYDAERVRARRTLGPLRES